MERAIGRMIGCAREREERREGGARDDLRERTDLTPPFGWMIQLGVGPRTNEDLLGMDGWVRGVRREHRCGCIQRSQRLCKKRKRKYKTAKMQKCKNGSKRWRSTAQPQDCWKTTCHVALKPPPAHEGGMYQGRNTMRALSCFSPWQDAQPNASPMSNSAGSWGLPKPARYPLPR